jgi:hypothetical protein
LSPMRFWGCCQLSGLRVEEQLRNESSFMVLLTELEASVFQWHTIALELAMIYL